MADGDSRSCLGVVKFYGPKRDDRGQLWGYITLLGADRRGEEVRFIEAHVENRVTDGQLVVVRLEGHRPRVRVTSVAEVQLSLQSLRLVESTALTYRDHDLSVPDILATAIGELPEQAVPSSIVGLLPAGELVRRVQRSPETLLGLLRECLSWGRSIDWLGRTSGGDATYGRSTRSRSLIVPSFVAFDSELAPEVADLLRAFPRPDLARGIAARASESLISRVAGDVAPVLRPIFAAAVPPASLARMPELLEMLTPTEQAEAVLRALASPGAEEIPLDVVRTALLSPDAMLGIAGLRAASRVALAQVPELLERLPAQHGLELALMVAPVADGSAWQDVVREAVQVCGQTSGSWDLIDAAVMQSRLLLSLGPAIARDLARSGALRGEVEHILVCQSADWNEETCAPSSDAVGHAIGGLLMQRLGEAQLSGDQLSLWRRAALSSIFSELTGEELRPTRPSEVADAIQRWVVCIGIEKMVEHRSSLRRLLPSCPAGIVALCEGKPATGDYHEPYCPRLGHGCSVANVDFSPVRDVNSWSITDLMGTPGTSEELEGKTYANAVAGWTNRLLELGERMRCDRCQDPLRANLQYSMKYTAAYGATRGSCAAGCGAPDVYFSHCFNCSEVIDSRESRYFLSEDGALLDVDGDPDRAGRRGKFLCIHCANGGEPWCPRCGLQVERPGSVANASRTCAACAHQVTARPRRRSQAPQAATRPPVAVGADNRHEHADWSLDPAIPVLRRLAQSRTRWGGEWAVDESPF